MNQPKVKGLRTTGFFGKNPKIGLIMFIIGSLIFAILAYNLVKQGVLFRLDLYLAEVFYTLALKSSPLIINIMIASYYIGNQGIIAVAVPLGVYFIYKRFWRELVMITVGSGGGGLLFLFLSHIFDRPRPFFLFDKQIWAASHSNIPGFPSGHTLGAVVFFGFLVYLFLPKIKSDLGKVLLVWAAFFTVLFIGFSRIYIGDHYFTDVIAGYAVGIAWLGLTFTFIELLFKKRKKKLYRGKEKRIDK